MKSSLRPQRSQRAGRTNLRQLAVFRYRLRQFLRFSEKAARASGLTPQQHQLLLGIAGFTDHGWATITELAEFLQERHNAVVGLVQRAESRGLVRKDHVKTDHRFVRVYLLPRGERVLAKLAQLHEKEVTRFQQGFSDESKTHANHANSDQQNSRRRMDAKRS